MYSNKTRNYEIWRAALFHNILFVCFLAVLRRLWFPWPISHCGTPRLQQVADLYLLPFFAAHKLHHFCQFATITGRDEHVPTVETLIQTVIERVQAIANELPFETYSHWLIM